MYQIEKETGDIVINGWENGIAPSPHKGIGNMRGVNIATEPGEVMCSYGRVQQSQTAITSGTLSFQDSSHLNVSVSTPSGATLKGGQWITVTNSSHTGELPNATYYVISSESGFTVIKVANPVSTFTYSQTAITGFTAGLTANFITAVNMGQPVQACTEVYFDGFNYQYRNFMLDTNGLMWVQDSGVTTPGVSWFLPYSNSLAPNANAGGIAYLNGWVHILIENVIYVQQTVRLGYRQGGVVGFDIMDAGILNTQLGSPNSHFTITTQSTNSIIFCDGPFVGSIQSTSNSHSATTAPIFSTGSYTFSGTTVTITNIIGGSIPLVNSTITFNCSPGGTIATGVNGSTTYFVKSVTAGTSSVTMTISSSIGGSAISFSGGSGTQYYNTYNPSIVSDFGDTFVFNSAALVLPYGTVTKSLCELGQGQIVVGSQSNYIYFWDGVSTTATSAVPLPESNVVNMINVDNNAIMFAGNKGNIYITNGSTASSVISVPDYTSGLVEPYFVWGGAAFIRGRVYFSIQDQTATHTGQCGGIWSFVPTQAAFLQQDTGASLRMENQSSYGTFNGRATVILPAYFQNVQGVQYWSGWVSTYNATSSGIDFSDTAPNSNQPAIIDTDIIPTGQILGRQKKTLSNIEFKLAAPLINGESVAIGYRTNLTDAFTISGMTVNYDNGASIGALSGYITSLPFQATQWLQLQATLTSTTNAGMSFVRLTEIRIRTT